MNPSSAHAGYSGTPLAKKLGIKEHFCIAALNAPPEYSELLAPLPAGATLSSVLSQSVDMVHLFAQERSSLAEALAALRKTLKTETPLWVSWPKKASGVKTDITEDTIREVALPLGYVDIKVCAVSNVWSGLKLVVRKALR
jgi:hypothetical protein